MPYKDKEKQKEHNKEYWRKHKEKLKEINKEYYQKNKEKIKDKEKEYREKHKEEMKKYMKEYYGKNKDKLKEKHKKYWIKNKNRLNKKQREYHKINREKMNEKSKEYYEKNKKRLVKYRKKINKNLYLLSVKKICDYYNITKPICFFDMEQIPFKFEVTKEDIIKQKFIIIDHKDENLTGLKDKYEGKSLARHILKSNENDLEKYQLLCSKHNLDKEALYEYYLALKEMKAEEADEIYKAYEDLFIYDKEKLHRKLREMGREDLIKGDDNNAL